MARIRPEQTRNEKRKKKRRKKVDDNSDNETRKGGKIDDCLKIRLLNDLKVQKRERERGKTVNLAINLGHLLP